MLVWKHLSLPVEAILNCHVVFFFFFDVLLHYHDLEGLSYCGFSHVHQYLILSFGEGVCFEVGVPAPNSTFINLNVELGQNFYSSASSLTSESSTSINHVEKC